LEAYISKSRYRLNIGGIVQGVGFRPFVYQLADRYNFGGYVYNNGSGVIIEIEGKREDIFSFVEALQSQKPPLCRIDTVDKTEIEPKNSENFIIRDSDKTAVSTMLSADIAMCDECYSEMSDKNNRRYKYPFINCTNCGPRYTIINDLPYDRKNTSMSKFEMCNECKAEYENPNDRRYHAQPISCFKCGVKLSYLSLYGDREKDEKKALKKICSIIKESQSVAIKGVGGFHIICNATDDKAVRELRLNKHRPTKPLAVMFKDLAQIKKFCTLSSADEKLILSKERPIVIVKKKEATSLSKFIAPNIDRIGVFLAYTPLHVILLDKLNTPIVATSANLSDEPIISDEREIFRKLPLVVQDILTYDREILNSCDDSVMLSIEDESIMLRMARGFAPHSLHVKNSSTKKILALGAHQKSTISIAFENNIIISPHIGDLNSIEAFEYFTRTLQTLKRIYKFEPDIIVCDKHPKYETTLWAKNYVKQNRDIELIELQHHYSHALACMAEYDIDKDVLAFCFDGTGYGDDGALWGGEVFIANVHNYKRIYHFKEFSLLGGEKAVKEPRRIALSILFEYFSLDEIQEMDTKLINSFQKSEIETFYKMYQKGINSPKSSSLGRLFDGVYALCGYIEALGYEGESGFILEANSENSKTESTYSFNIQDGVIDYKEMILEILQEEDKNIIAKKFILTLSKIIIKISDKHPKLPVILSGGVFQNRVLLLHVTKELKKINRRYYIQSKTPINDGGISLGQAYFAVKNR